MRCLFLLQEADKLMSAFKEPEFRRMFQDYMSEISNPDQRAEYEQYLEQMERDGEAPKDVELLRPEVGVLAVHLVKAVLSSRVAGCLCVLYVLCVWVAPMQP